MYDCPTPQDPSAIYYHCDGSSHESNIRAVPSRLPNLAPTPMRRVLNAPPVVVVEAKRASSSSSSSSSTSTSASSTSTSLTGQSQLQPLRPLPNPKRSTRTRKNSGGSRHDSFRGSLKNMKKALQAHTSSALTRTENGATFLMWIVTLPNMGTSIAALAGDPRINVNDVDQWNRTALIYAIMSNRIENVQTLLDVPGIDVNCRDGDNGTPLMYAAWFNRVEIVRILLKRKDIQINLINDYGDSALMVAVQKGNNDAVHALLDAPRELELDLNIKDTDGDTVFELIDPNNQELFQVFERFALSQSYQYSAEELKNDSIAPSSAFATQENFLGKRSSTSQSFNLYELPCIDYNCGIFGVYGRENVTRLEVVQQLLAASNNSHIRRLMAGDIQTFVLDTPGDLPRWLESHLRSWVENRLNVSFNIQFLRNAIINDTDFRQDFFEALQYEEIFKAYVENFIGGRSGSTANSPSNMLNFNPGSDDGAMAAIAALNNVSLDVYEEYIQADGSRLLIRISGYQDSQANGRVVSLLHATGNHFRLLIPVSAEVFNTPANTSFVRRGSASSVDRATQLHLVAFETSHKASHKTNISLSLKSGRSLRVIKGTESRNTAPKLQDLFTPVGISSSSNAERLLVGDSKVIDLRSAIESGDAGKVDMLLQEGVDIESTDREGRIPLMFAVIQPQPRIDIIDSLIGRGIDLLNATDENGDTALTLVAALDEKVYSNSYASSRVYQWFSSIVDLSLVGSLHAQYLDIVKALLAANIDVNVKNKNGDTALTLAARHGRSEIVKTLFPKIKDINVRNNDGNTALILASQYGHIEIVKFLLAKDSGKSVNTSNNDGDTALTFAARNGHPEVVKLLLGKNSGINVNVAENQGNRALEHAAQNERIEVLKLLIEDLSIRNNLKFKETVLRSLINAAKKGHIRVIGILLESQGISINDTITTQNEESTAFTSAAEQGHASLVQALISDKRLNLVAAAQGKSALEKAVLNGRTEVVKVLLSDKIVPSAKLYFRSGELLIVALESAAENGYEEIVQLLLNVLSNDEQANRAISNSLRKAIKLNYVKVAQVLLNDKRLDVNAQVDKYGNTPLTLAAKYGHDEIVEVLVNDPRVIVNTARGDGMTALMLAVQQGHIEVVKVLLKLANLKVNQPNNNHETAFIFAEKLNSISPYKDEIIRLLRERGAQ